jgi:putative lipoic acid-binding regulatory protein
MKIQLNIWPFYGRVASTEVESEVVEFVQLKIPSSYKPRLNNSSRQGLYPSIPAAQ